MRIATVITLFVALLAFAGAAEAATISFDASSQVNGISSNPDYSLYKRNSKNDVYISDGALTGTEGGVTWTLEAFSAGDPHGVLALDRGGNDTYDPTTDGLGANLDAGIGWGMLDPSKDNVLVLTFSEPVYLDSLTYTHIGSEEFYAYSIDGGIWVTGQGSASSPKPQQGYVTVDVGGMMVTSVAIASGGSTGSSWGHINFGGFEAHAMVAETPEPMTMLLMGSGLGISAYMRRRFRR